MSDRSNLYRDIFSGKNQSIIKPEYHHMFGPKVKLDTEFKKYMPNQKRHRYVSFIKSGVRIVGYLLIPFSLPLAVGVLVFSEIIGIIEELV